MPAPSQPLIDEAARYIQAKCSLRPEYALILGTGLGELGEAIEAVATFSYHDIPFFPRSTALAHKGVLRVGYLNGTPVAALQGRSHMYEGYPYEQLMLPTRVLAALGAQTLIVTNAAGGVNPQFVVGDVMVMTDHINLQFSRDPAAALGLAEPNPVGRAVQPRDTYDGGLIQAALQIARAENFPVQRGVYVAVTGPNYETRAEYRFFRKIGGDAVGMSTVPEAIAAAACGMKVLGMSIISNVARPDQIQTVSADEVVVAANLAGNKVRLIIEGVVRGG